MRLSAILICVTVIGFPMAQKLLQVKLPVRPGPFIPYYSKFLVVFSTGSGPSPTVAFLNALKLHYW
jgi:hypothetical protein